MTSAPEPALTEGARVRIDLDDDGGAIECVVIAFVGPAILARTDRARGEGVSGRLSSGASGFLVIEQDGHVRALRCSATSSGEATLALHITDGFRLGQRRESTRVTLALAAELAPEVADSPVSSTTTIDVSVGGVLVRRPDATPPHDRYTLTLSGGGLRAPVVTGASLARELPDAFGLQFTRTEPPDRQRLTQLVLSHLTVRD